MIRYSEEYLFPRQAQVVLGSRFQRTIKGRNWREIWNG
jgi:hypothetical protein